MSTPGPAHLVRFGDFEFDVETGYLWHRGHRVRLQEQPRQVLAMLLARPGELVTREALRGELWQEDTFVDFEAGVNVVVNKIRHVLRDSALSPRFIETIPRRGYRFIAPVAAAPAHDAAPEQVVKPDPGGTVERSRFPVLWIGVLAALVALGATGVWVVASRPRSSSAEPRSEAPPDRRSNSAAIAIFENRTADVSLDPLGHLAADGIIRIAATVGGASVLPQPVRVSSGTSTADVSLLVTGAYYAYEDVVEFRAHILDGARGRLLYGTGPVIARRSHPAEALSLLEQKVAGAIAVHVDEFFGGLDVVSSPPTLDVYREYRAELERFWSDYPRALASFERVLEQEPRFLPAAMVKRIAHRNLGDAEGAETILTRAEARWDQLTAAERLWVELARATRQGRRAQALRILEDLEHLVPSSLFVNHSLVHLSVLANRPRAAVRAYDKRRLDERTLRHSIGSLRRDAVIEALHMLGEYDRELREARLAQAYVPGDRRELESEARALVASARLSEVPAVIDRSLSMTADASPPHSPGEVMEGVARELRVHGYTKDSVRLAARAVAWHRSRAEDADTSDADRAAFARALYLAEEWRDAGELFSALAREDANDVEALAYLGCVAARIGDAARARRISTALARLGGSGDWRAAGVTAAYGRARIAALLGARERAVDLLRDALTRGLPYGLELHSEPDFESLWQYAPYLALTRPLD